MNFIIHRGLEQIGGCITEISTESSRVFIDMGQNLPGNGEQTTPEQDKGMKESITFPMILWCYKHEISNL